MSGTNRLGIKGAIASLIAAGALCTGGLGQGIPACDDPDPKAGDCFEVTPGIPGCQNAECCKIVCDMDIACCLFEWDQQCVNIALANCPGAVCDTCGAFACGDCFVTHGTPWCNDECTEEACPGCCATVCAADPFCCDVEWDAICVGEAMDLCPCTPDDAPANDDCANAIDIAEGVFEYSTLCGSQDGPSLPGTPCNAKTGGVPGVGIDIWYNYTATKDGAVRVYTCDLADYGTQIAVYDGCACPADAATLIGCNEDGVGCGAGTGSEIIFEVVAGACYKISVGGTFANTGTGTLIVELLGTPENDDCALALPINLDQSIPFHNFEATVDGTPSPVCDFGGNNDIDRDIWFELTSPVTGTLQVNLCASTFDTKAAVYEGGECPPMADPIACDDDGCGLQSRLEFEAVKGETYLIRVGSRPGMGVGLGTLIVAAAAADDCADAVEIFDGETFFITLGATTDGPSHAACDQFGGDPGGPQTHNDIWFKYTATATGGLRIDTCGTAGYDTKIAIYADDCTCTLTDATLLGCIDDGGNCPGFTSDFQVNVVQGNCYTIRIGGFEATEAGVGTVTITPACDVEVPPGAVDESEACGVASNDGCNAGGAPGDFVNISSGDIIHGESWAFDGSRDTDWFLLDTASLKNADTNGNGLVKICYSIQAEIPLTVAIVPIEDSVFPYCTSGFFFENTPSEACEIALIGTYGEDLVNNPVETTGSYALFVAPFDPALGNLLFDFPCGTPLGNDYIACVTVVDDGEASCPSAEGCFGAAPPCPADIDGSGDVGVKDLLFLLGAWGDCPAKGPCLADFDDSGDVGVKDLLFLLGAWGDCP